MLLVFYPHHREVRQYGSCSISTVIMIINGTPYFHAYQDLFSLNNGRGGQNKYVDSYRPYGYGDRWGRVSPNGAPSDGVVASSQNTAQAIYLRREY